MGLSKERDTTDDSGGRVEMLTRITIEINNNENTKNFGIYARLAEYNELEVGDIVQLLYDNNAYHNMIVTEIILEGEFSELGGWEAENQIEQMLSGLGLEEDYHGRMMSELDESQKVRVLLAQAIFGEPDILLLDEPTNGLDLESIAWLEEFLIDFPNTVIVVSHDRHFLNAVCTCICDIDYGKITPFAGNYDFWYQMSQIMQRQAKDQAKKREEKMKDLREFILRFASNAAKSKQATSRKKIYDKLALEELQVTSRKFPYVNFKPDREVGNNVLRVEKLNYNVEGVQLLKDFSLTVNKGDTIITSGLTPVFPSGILVGVVEQTNLTNSDNYHHITLQIAADYRKLSYVQVIHNRATHNIEYQTNQSLWSGLEK